MRGWRVKAAKIFGAGGREGRGREEMVSDRDPEGEEDDVTVSRLRAVGRGEGGVV